MNILKVISDEYYDTPIKDNQEYTKLCEQRDELEEQIIMKSNKELRELFIQYSDLLDKYAMILTDNAIEFTYNKIKDILKESSAHSVDNI